MSTTAPASCSDGFQEFVVDCVSPLGEFGDRSQALGVCGRQILRLDVVCKLLEGGGSFGSRLAGH